MELYNITKRTYLLKTQQQCACVSIKGKHLLKYWTVHTFTPDKAQVISRCTYTDSADHSFLLPLPIHCGVAGISELPQDHWQLRLFWWLSHTHRVCSAVGATHRLRLTAQKNSNYILLEKGIIKPTCQVGGQIPDASSLECDRGQWCLCPLPKTGKDPASVDQPGDHNTHGAAPHPQAPTLLHTINHHVVWLLDRRKGWWKLHLSSCGWKTAELPTTASQREGMGLEERVSLAKHSQNPQPLPKLGILIHPAATIHIGCLSVTRKQLPKSSEVHISFLKLRLF